jgi:2-methylisocitrate lyase-like PEP mutase family enzyme
MTTQKEKAEIFNRLHHQPGSGILVLLNAWDAGSARLFEHAGAGAVATTSAGIALSQGYLDGEQLPWREQVRVIESITSAVSIPVTADIESGYSSNLEQLASRIQDVIAAGAVGINLEDSIATSDEAPLRPMEEQVARIAVVRETAEAKNIPLFINARTDTYWDPKVQPDSRFPEAVKRARAYIEAGASGIFVPGATDREDIRRLASEISAPLNILAMAGTPPVHELGQLGAKRVSVGAGPARAALATARKIARELFDSGTYSTFLNEAIPYAELRKFFKGNNKK